MLQQISFKCTQKNRLMSLCTTHEVDFFVLKDNYEETNYCDVSVSLKQF